MTTTIIKNADWVIRWDNEKMAHHYIKNADVVYKDNTLTFVGKNYNGPQDEVIKGEGLCVMPGLINLHAHPSLEVTNKGFDGDGEGGQLGEFQWINYQFFAYTPAVEDNVICAEVAMCELLRSGVTTLVDISYPYPGWNELAERSGLRLYLTPMFTSTTGTWNMDSPYELSYHWAEDEGRDKMSKALEIIDWGLKHSSGRLSGIVMPSTVDTCTPELMQIGLAAARERGIPLQIHAAQLISEFQEIVRRHGVTPIKLLEQAGVLVPETIVGHAIMLDHYRTTKFYGTSDDLEILGNSGASIAHCPLIFARCGDYLDNIGSYRKAGVNIGMGTDTYPHNLLEEMRLALLTARIVSGQSKNTSTADIFYAATIGGANALHRQDIGRITPGAKADLVLLDLKDPSMQPMRDPLRSLIHVAAERGVRDVIIDGVMVVKNRQVLTLDHAGANRQLEGVRQRMEAATLQNDPHGRTVEELSPLALPVDSE